MADALRGVAGTTELRTLLGVDTGLFDRSLSVMRAGESAGDRVEGVLYS
jgi:hypothetical protein